MLLVHLKKHWKQKFHPGTFQTRTQGSRWCRAPRDRTVRGGNLGEWKKVTRLRTRFLSTSSKERQLPRWDTLICPKKLWLGLLKQNQSVISLFFFLIELSWNCFIPGPRREFHPWAAWQWRPRIERDVVHAEHHKLQDWYLCHPSTSSYNTRWN